MVVVVIVVVVVVVQVLDLKEKLQEMHSSKSALLNQVQASSENQIATLRYYNTVNLFHVLHMHTRTAIQCH